MDNEVEGGARPLDRASDPKPTTADTMVPLPTSGGDGVMLRRAGQASPPVMEPIGNRKLSVGSNYDVLTYDKSGHQDQSHK